VVNHQLLARVDALDPITLSTQAFRHGAHDLGLEGILAPSVIGERTVLAIFFGHLPALSKNPRSAGV
jgi:hypothetical protein